MIIKRMKLHKMNTNPVLYFYKNIFDVRIAFWFMFGNCIAVIAGEQSVTKFIIA